LIRDNIWRCVEHIAAVSARSGRKLHLGLEPERWAGLKRSAGNHPFFLNNCAPNIPAIRD